MTLFKHEFGFVEKKLCVYYIFELLTISTTFSSSAKIITKGSKYLIMTPKLS